MRFWPRVYSEANESDMPEQNHTEEEMTRLRAELMRNLPYRMVLFNLFIHPKYGLFLTLRRPNWWRAALVLLLMGGVGGCLKTMNEMPDLLSNGRKVSMFLSDNLGDLGFKDGKITWTEVPKYPLTGYFANFRVDVYADSESVKRNALANSRAKTGLVVTAKQIDFWMAMDPVGAAPRFMSILTPKMIASFEKSQQSGKIPAVLTREVLLDYVKVWCLALLSPALMLSYWFSMLSSMLLFALFFALAVQFRRGTMRKNFASSASMGLHCCIPPFFAALIYELFVPSLGSFDTIFVVIFVLYIIYMQIEDRWFRDAQKKFWQI